MAASSVLVPVEAVQRAEGQAYVFVKKTADAFEARRIVLGNADDEVAEVRKGLNEGEQVAMTGAA